MEKIDGISEVLGTSFKTEDIQKVSEKASELTSQAVSASSSQISFEDKEYLKREMKEHLEGMKDAKNFVQEQFMRPGIKASEVETAAIFMDNYSKLLSEYRKFMMDLVNIDLSKQRLNQTLQIKTGSINIQNNNNTMLLDSKTLDEMIENAEKNSKIKMIEVDFEQDNQIK